VALRPGRSGDGGHGGDGGHAAEAVATVRRRLSGGVGWLGLAVLVVAWDLVAPETLSSAFDRARSSPVGASVVLVSWGLLTGHLFGLLPERVDPFSFPSDRGRTWLHGKLSAGWPAAARPP
jgi:hypothetical protein